MTTILIHRRALWTFFGKFFPGVAALYRNEVSYHRNALAVAHQLRDGFTPEHLAREVCESEGVPVGSHYYFSLVSQARDIQRRFNV